MYKRINFLLNKLLSLTLTEKPIPVYGPDYKIEQLLNENKDLLTTDNYADTLFNFQ